MPLDRHCLQSRDSLVCLTRGRHLRIPCMCVRAYVIRTYARTDMHVRINVCMVGWVDGWVGGTYVGDVTYSH